ncbi:MAG TPA: cation transporter [Nitrospiria bacterium]|nr:cation transporter [Nitrospiria bacterium]
MRHLMASLIPPVVLGVLLLTAPAGAAEQKTVLMLGGKFCEFYPKELTAALKAVKGVTSVDLESMKGHVIVTHDGTVKPETLINAVKSVKGTRMGINWYCDAMVMD